MLQATEVTGKKTLFQQHHQPVYRSFWGDHNKKVDSLVQVFAGKRLKHRRNEAARISENLGLQKHGYLRITGNMAKF
jgi:hypothetical protein